MSEYGFKIGVVRHPLTCHRCFKGLKVKSIAGYGKKVCLNQAKKGNITERSTGGVFALCADCLKQSVLDLKSFDPSDGLKAVEAKNKAVLEKRNKTLSRHQELRASARFLNKIDGIKAHSRKIYHQFHFVAFSDKVSLNTINQGDKIVVASPDNPGGWDGRFACMKLSFTSGIYAAFRFCPDNPCTHKWAVNHQHVEKFIDIKDPKCYDKIVDYLK